MVLREAHDVVIVGMPGGTRLLESGADRAHGRRVRGSAACFRGSLQTDGELSVVSPVPLEPVRAIQQLTTFCSICQRERPRSSSTMVVMQWHQTVWLVPGHKYSVYLLVCFFQELRAFMGSAITALGEFSQRCKLVVETQ